MKERSKEILTLTKMNWNSSDGISRLPMTILFARRVGEPMCELSDNAIPKDLDSAGLLSKHGAVEGLSLAVRA
jgi:hypothetical protein